MHSLKCHHFNLKKYNTRLTHLNYVERHVSFLLVEAFSTSKNIHLLCKKISLRKTYSLMGSYNPSLGCFNNKEECIGFNFLLQSLCILGI